MLFFENSDQINCFFLHLEIDQKLHCSTILSHASQKKIPHLTKIICESFFFNIYSWNLIQNWNFRIVLRAMRCTKFYLLLFFENSDQINCLFLTWKSTKKYIAAQFGITLDENNLWIVFFNINSWNLIKNWNLQFVRAMRCIKFQLVLFFEKSDQIVCFLCTWKSTKNWIVAQLGLTLDQNDLWEVFF